MKFFIDKQKSVNWTSLVNHSRKVRTRRTSTKKEEGEKKSRMYSITLWAVIKQEKSTEI